MTEDTPSGKQGSTLSTRSSAEAALTEGVRHVDIIHTSLAGMTAIVSLLLFAIALPILGHQPVTAPMAFAVMIVTSFTGIGGLYYLNFRVHKHVTDQARLTEVLVNSLGQGFVVFGRDGLCGKVYSQACLDLLETVPADRSITDVLHIPDNEKSDFMDWVEVLYKSDHALGFEDVVHFFPAFFPHSRQRRVSLVYKPLYGKKGELRNIVLIATDQTEEYAARQAAERQQNFAEMICRVFKDRNQFMTVLAHARDFLDKTDQIDEKTVRRPVILRELHTLKASLKQFNLLEFSELIHKTENELRDPSVETSAVFVDKLRAARVSISEALTHVNDDVCSLIGRECEWRGNIREIPENDIYAFAVELQAADPSSETLRRYLEVVVAVSIRDCFRSFERELAELVGMLDKQIKPVLFEGSNPKILARHFQDLLFSFTHICRNIADHGIEPPVTRMARGKDAAGQVTVFCDVVPSIQKEGGKDLHIVISDDGNGIDPARVREKLALKDPDGAWRFEDDHAVIQKILDFGFTTAERVTAVSGHGVGMEAVELEVRRLGGTITVSSELYKGASFDIRVPYVMRLE